MELIELLTELKELQEERNSTPYKEDAWDALEKINGIVSRIVSEYDDVVRDLLGGWRNAVDDVCPHCKGDWTNHDEENCAFAAGQKVLERG